MAEINFTHVAALIRLANNNPSEHEANAAARKVCKLLAEYKFVQNTVRAEPRPQPSRPYQSDFTQDMYEDLLRKMRQYGKKYSDSWRQNEPPHYGRKEHEQQKQREVYMRDCKQCKQKFMGLNPTEDICPRCHYGFGPKQTDDAWRNWHQPYEKPEAEKKSRQCSKCGHTKMTSRITNIFVCNECQWNEFREKENERADNREGT